MHNIDHLTDVDPIAETQSGIHTRRSDCAPEYVEMQLDEELAYVQQATNATYRAWFTTRHITAGRETFIAVAYTWTLRSDGVSDRIHTWCCAEAPNYTLAMDQLFAKVQRIGLPKV